MFVGDQRLWDYLEDDTMDKRFELTAQVINTPNLVYVDLNCGIGGYARYAVMPRFYWGNDNKKRYLKKCPKYDFCKFEYLDDKKVIGNIPMPFDVLLFFGATIGGRHESKTATSTYYNLINNYRPLYVVWEGCTEYWTQYWSPNAYRVVFEAHLDFGTEARFRRKLVIYERR